MNGFGAVLSVLAQGVGGGAKQYVKEVESTRKLMADRLTREHEAELKLQSGKEMLRFQYSPEMTVGKAAQVGAVAGAEAEAKLPIQKRLAEVESDIRVGEKEAISKQELALAGSPEALRLLKQKQTIEAEGAGAKVTAEEEAKADVLMNTYGFTREGLKSSKTKKSKDEFTQKDISVYLDKADKATKEVMGVGEGNPITSKNRGEFIKGRINYFHYVTGGLYPPGTVIGDKIADSKGKLVAIKSKEGGQAKEEAVRSKKDITAETLGSGMIQEPPSSLFGPKPVRDVNIEGFTGRVGPVPRGIQQKSLFGVR